MTTSMLLATVLLAAPATTTADDAPSAPTHVVVAGPRYGAGALHRMLLGTDYRRTWTTPVRVEVLDLSSFGGLQPARKGGGKQTLSLGFKTPDGREFRFRSVDKDPSATLPEELKDTAAEWLVQDQIRASYPVAPLVVDGLADAAGIAHVEHRLYVMPDDARLGEFQGEFKGLLGILEENPQTTGLTPGFDGVSRIVETAELFKLLQSDPQEQVDARAFLRARLFDMFIGDWDRHQEQWEWMKKEGQPWLPYPTDRDMAFADYDGLVLAAARGGHPVLVTFKPDYPRVLGLAWNSRVVDRRLLSGLERSAFTEVAAELQGRLTDAVIDAAVRRLPPEYYALDGTYLTTALKSRRDHLPQVTNAFYQQLSREVEVYGTDAAEVADIERAERDDSIEVRITAAGAAEPYFRRRFLQSETNEVRIFLRGGDDRALSRGNRVGGLQVRVMGGLGDDTVDDSAGGRTHFFDHEGNNQVVEGPGTKESSKPYEHPLDWRKYPLRDWGSRTLGMPFLSAGGDVGVMAGWQLDFTDYGFRKHPWAARHRLRAGYAFGRRGFKAEYEGEFQHTNSRKRTVLLARASDVEVVRFFGFGNDTLAPLPSTFFRSEQRQFLFQPSFRLGLDRVDLSLGPRVKFQQTNLEQPTFLRVSRPYGVGDFGQVGANLSFNADSRRRPGPITRGALLRLEGNYYPEAWSVEEAFGEAHGEAAVYLWALALRVGGKKVWGRFPFHESAFVGGPDTVRGLRRQRYAGDAAVFGNAELRVPLFTVTLALPVRFGVLGLADAGRVYLEGESSDTWHKGFGGGAWISILKPENTISVTAARDPDAIGRERATRVYFHAGFSF